VAAKSNSPDEDVETELESVTRKDNKHTPIFSTSSIFRLEIVGGPSSEDIRREDTKDKTLSLACSDAIN
jgi:hypothetical protein